MVFVVIGGIVAGMVAVGTVVDSLIRRHRRSQAKGTAWADPHAQAEWQTGAAGPAADASRPNPPAAPGAAAGFF